MSRNASTLADAVVHRLDGRQVVLHVALVFPADERFAGQRHALSVAENRHRVRLGREPLRELRPGEARRRRQLQVAVGQIGRDALLVLVQRVGARRVRVPERDRLRNPLRGELRGVRFARLPRPMRRLVVHHQEERLVARAVLEKVEGPVGDDLGGVSTGVGLLVARRVEHGIAVRTLAGQDLPAIETGGIAAQVPLADHAGVVAARLQQPRHRHARAVEPVEHGHAVQVRVLAGQNRGPARRADRVGGKDAASAARPRCARRSRCGVWLTRDPYALMACAA